MTARNGANFNAILRTPSFTLIVGRPPDQTKFFINLSIAELLLPLKERTANAEDERLAQVELPDDDPHAFGQALAFLYGDELEPEVVPGAFGCNSFKDTGLDLEETSKALVKLNLLSRKYRISQLLPAIYERLKICVTKPSRFLCIAEQIYSTFDGNNNEDEHETMFRSWACNYIKMHNSAIRELPETRAIVHKGGPLAYDLFSPNMSLTSTAQKRKIGEISQSSPAPGNPVTLGAPKPSTPSGIRAATQSPTLNRPSVTMTSFADLPTTDRAAFATTASNFTSSWGHPPKSSSEDAVQIISTTSKRTMRQPTHCESAIKTEAAEGSQSADQSKPQT